MRQPIITGKKWEHLGHFIESLVLMYPQMTLEEAKKKWDTMPDERKES
jgi:hypothetical protein